MKSSIFSIILVASLAVGCAHNPNAVSGPAPSGAPRETPAVMVAAATEQSPLPPSDTTAKPGRQDLEEYGDIDDSAKSGDKETLPVDDPWEPFNRAMYHFNDKLYFWVVKPVAQGYGTVVPEPARIGVDNFFTNLAFPIRFVNSLLQADFGSATAELGRFVINTVWGAGGFLDPASQKKINLVKRDKDFGQTLGVYGIGQGFYIDWPIWGPSSSRDTVGSLGDLMLHPFTYLNPWYVFVGTRGYEKINSTSLRIGDYEALKEAAIDPYVAIRDAYIQYRLNQVSGKGVQAPVKDTGDVKNK
jgi:phospholipid-binding lipoprotein MlaA